MDEIVNRVAKSSLKVLDLSDYYPNNEFVSIDISQWMFKGIVVKEKEFRAFLKTHNWQQYQDNYVAIHCSTDAIVPTWTYLLVATYLQPYAQKTVFGSINELKIVVWETIIKTISIQEFEEKRVIIKGCAKKDIPINAYALLINRLQPKVKSMFFGEACSAVPLYKNKMK